MLTAWYQGQCYQLLWRMSVIGPFVQEELAHGKAQDSTRINVPPRPWLTSIEPRGVMINDLEGVAG